MDKLQFPPRPVSREDIILTTDLSRFEKRRVPMAIVGTDGHIKAWLERQRAGDKKKYPAAQQTATFAGRTLADTGIRTHAFTAFGHLARGNPGAAKGVMPHMKAQIDRLELALHAAKAAYRELEDKIGEAEGTVSKDKKAAQGGLPADSHIPDSGTTRPDGADPKVPALSGETYPDPSISNLGSLNIGRATQKDIETIVANEAPQPKPDPQNQTAADGYSPISTDEEAEAVADKPVEEQDQGHQALKAEQGAEGTGVVGNFDQGANIAARPLTEPPVTGEERGVGTPGVKDTVTPAQQAEAQAAAEEQAQGDGGDKPKGGSRKKK